ncbi:hypothetical protein DL766_005859 [Monosporascus sp. MC13-8B]|uniref:Dipeptidylpeptidase IV N-terminal domain-containing protein n=1 Tax=Monosporascus cannonballus TaxID=155416 RepID=A0ABY0GY12_9PEZI|nr:hypothetical protein DL762_009246 [Monosporascus cannonballus]RYO79105.1 hypothetical protein DL763_009411 [Monosporascus cannonballus]RYP28469.1 hypothetical protein DL766_005859 [Monosporascus sp. MC13-8B]
MAIFHAPYHVWVKDYRWTARNLNLCVQSPVINLGNTVSPPVFRQLEGNNKNEPRVAETADELMDDVGEPEYATEAHGVYVPTEPRGRHLPLWVPYRQSSAAVKDGEIAFVDLTSNTTRTGSVARVCWVPDRRSPDGKLYTVISGARVWKRGRETISNTLVCVQAEGSPEKAKLIQVPSAELSRTCKYPGLHPTYLNPFPDHRHGEDRDCPLGPMHEIMHEKHRIFAAHSPLECIITPNERHQHCESLRLSVEPPQSINMMFDWPEAAHGFRSVSSHLQYAPYPTPELPPPAQPTPFLLDTIQLELASLPEPDYEFIAMREPT